MVPKVPPMMKMRLAIPIVTSLLLSGALSAMAQVSLDSLLNEMTSLDVLTRMPDPAYTVKQYSSYDRLSQGAPQGSEDWFANEDRGNFLRSEEREGATEWVMMDAAGPGAIVRIWSANPVDAGIVRIYLDHEATPTIEMPFAELLSGQAAPFIEPIAGVRSAGWNNYFPIPYAEHCKVTASKPEFFYHINYRTYDGAVEVASFPREIPAEALNRIRAVAERLSSPMGTPSSPARSETRSLTYRVEPGAERAEVLSQDGSAICAMEVRVTADDVATALRECVLTISYDDAAHPQVCAPLGDFFGTAPGANAYASLPLAVRDDGTLTSAWIMPFQRSARIAIRNTSDAPVQIDLEMGIGEYEWTDRSMYFHANWRGEYPVPTRPRRDWTLIDIKGAGRFVGTMMHVVNPVLLWWGEGDEKIYVNDEAFPSHFGTGTEDYFGYAWCSPVPFTHAYHNQTRCDGPENYGHTCVSRFHVLDNIPFTEAFRFDMEIWHAWNCEIALAATTYWYALPGATSKPEGIDDADLVIVTPPPPPSPRSVEGALEAESLEILEQSGGKLVVEDNAKYHWSAGKQVRWSGGTPGDSVTFAFPVEKSGRYEVRAAFTKTKRCGIVQLRVNGEPANGELDLYDPTVEPSGEISLGVYELTDGQNILTARIIGKNARTVGDTYAFGLDYLMLQPAP